MVWYKLHVLLIAFAIFVCYVKAQHLIQDYETKKFREARNGYSQNKVEDIRINSSPDVIISYYGYGAQNHTVQTSDGYILTMHRITENKRKSCPKNKTVVFLQHGLMSSSSDWLLPGPNNSLAFLLADLCFDVWLGNSRGNKYSRAHVSLDPNEKKFWDFSWHEIGIYDLTACIDYILEKTGNEKLIYVGHSQGTTISFVLLSERPEYNNKISMLISLAPVCYRPPVFSSFISNFFANQMAGFSNAMSNIMGYEEMKPIPNHSQNYEPIKKMIFLSSGKSEELYDPDVYAILYQRGHGGASSKQLIHYYQLGLAGKFQYFDNGMFGNLMKYGNISPPRYNLKNITVPTTFFVGVNDKMAPPEEAQKCYVELHNPNNYYVVKHPTFNHLDFLFAKNIKSLLYDQIISLMINDRL